MAQLRTRERQRLRTLESEAEHGDVAAMSQLARELYNGSLVGGPAARPSDGVAWWRRAAEGGNVGAMSALGHVYCDGSADGSVKRDYEEARVWLTRAIDAGDAEAMLRLGHMYQHGQGVAVDLIEARDLFIRAHRAGFDDAARHRKLVEEAMAKDPVYAGWRAAQPEETSEGAATRGHPEA